MKFGKNISVQQAKYPELRYIDYKGLKKRIKRGDQFEASLDEEIEFVNISFSARVLDIQASLDLHAEDGTSSSVSDSLKVVMRIAERVETLRRFAVWNAVAVVKILKKQSKNSASSHHMSSTWLSKQLFFSGSDFAQLQATLESVAAQLCRSRLVELSGKLGPELQVDSQNVGGFFSCPLLFPEERCPICLELCIDAVELSSCGHKFCWKCVVLGPIAYAPGEYRLSRCSVCRNELPLDPTRNFKTVCSSQLEFLSRIAAPEEEEECESVSSVETLVGWGGLENVLRCRPKIGNVQSEKERQAIDTLDYSSGNHPSTFFCSLCCEPLLLEAVSTTPCKHHFHRVCLEKNALPICPLCGDDIPLELAVPRFHHSQLSLLGTDWQPASASCACEAMFPDGPCKFCNKYSLGKLPPVKLYGRVEMTSYLQYLPAALSAVPEAPAAGNIYYTRFGVGISSFSPELIAEKKRLSLQYV